MTNSLKITFIGPNDIRLDCLVDEARSEGYKFVDRLLSEAKAGINLFDKDGEVFCGAFVNGQLVGCGGVNIDPYTNERVGRLRHVYVLNAVRRQGVATGLVKELLMKSKFEFGKIRLRTPDQRADKFYEAIGFQTTSEQMATHIICTRTC